MKSNKAVIIIVVLAVLIVSVNMMTVGRYFKAKNVEPNVETVTHTITAKVFPIPDRIIVHSTEKEVVLEKDDLAFAEIIKINESRVQPNWQENMNGRGPIENREEILKEKHVEYVYDNPIARVYPYYNEYEHVAKSFFFYVTGEWNNCVGFHEIYEGNTDIYHRFGDLNVSAEFVEKVNEILESAPLS